MFYPVNQSATGMVSKSNFWEVPYNRQCVRNTILAPWAPSSAVVNVSARSVSSSFGDSLTNAAAASQEGGNFNSRGSSANPNVIDLSASSSSVQSYFDTQQLTGPYVIAGVASGVLLIAVVVGAIYNKRKPVEDDIVVVRRRSTVKDLKLSHK